MESQVKNLTKLFQFCYILPKLELHAHLTGSIRPKTIFDLLTNDTDKDEFAKLVSGTRKLDECHLIFKYIYKILTSLDVVKRITREMLIDWSKQNCYYLEIRSNIKAIGNNTKYDYLVLVLKEIQEFNNNKNENVSGMQSRYILSINREYSFEIAQDTLNVFKRLKTEQPTLAELVVGVDYSGLEGKELFGEKELAEILNEYRKLGLKITMHIGEIKDYKKIDYDLLKPNRLGHTDYLSKDDIQEIINLGIPYECCPSSSYTRLGYVSYKDVNFKNFYKKYNDKGEEYTKYSINTDDTSLFNSDLSNEYYEIASAFDLDSNDLINLVINSADTIFDDNYKIILKERLNEFKSKI